MRYSRGDISKYKLKLKKNVLEGQINTDHNGEKHLKKNIKRDT